MTRPVDDGENLRKLFLANVGRLLEFLSQQCESKMQIFDVCLVSTSLKLLNGMLPRKSAKPDPLRSFSNSEGVLILLARSLTIVCLSCSCRIYWPLICLLYNLEFGRSLGVEGQVESAHIFV